MQTGNKTATLTKIVYWTNAILAVPYLVSACYKLLLSFPYQYSHGSFGASIFILTYIIFYCLFIYSLIRFSKWCRWLVLIDAISGLAFIFLFPAAGAYMLAGSPAEFVYRFLHHMDKYVLYFLIFIGRASISTFNIFYFFGGPIFRFAKKNYAAHAFWIIPSIIMVGVPVYFVISAARHPAAHTSPQATRIAEQEFKKITCDQVRENNNKERVYSISGYKVLVSFNYGYSRILVTAPDGGEGREGGIKDFCRSDYKTSYFYRARDISNDIEVERHKSLTGYQFKDEILSLKTYDIAGDANYLWIGSDRGLLRYDKKKGSWTLHGNPEGLPGDFAWDVHLRDGKVTAEVLTIPKLGHANPVGFFELRPDTLMWVNIQRKSKPSDLIVENKYRCEASLGTYDEKSSDFKGGNVTCYSIPDEALRKRFELSNGLSHGYCYKIAYMGNKLWVSHWEENRGLSVIDMATDEVRVIKESKNGLALGGRDLAVDGRYIWVGQSTGVVRFNTETLEASRYSAHDDGLPGCWVSGIAVDNNAVWVALSRTSCHEDCDHSGIVKFMRTP